MGSLKFQHRSFSVTTTATATATTTTTSTTTTTTTKEIFSLINIYKVGK